MWAIGYVFIDNVQVISYKRCVPSLLLALFFRNNNRFGNEIPSAS